MGAYKSIKISLSSWKNWRVRWVDIRHTNKNCSNRTVVVLIRFNNGKMIVLGLRDSLKSLNRPNKQWRKVWIKKQNNMNLSVKIWSSRQMTYNSYKTRFVNWSSFQTIWWQDSVKNNRKSILLNHKWKEYKPKKMNSRKKSERVRWQVSKNHSKPTKWNSNYLKRKIILKKSKTNSKLKNEKINHSQTKIPAWGKKWVSLKHNLKNLRNKRNKLLKANRATTL